MRNFSSHAPRFAPLASVFVLLTLVLTFQSEGWAQKASQSETTSQADRDLASSFKQDPTTFRFHMPTEPSTLDPSRLTNTDASYLFANVMRGLYTYSNEKGLVAEGAKTCRFTSPLRLECELADDHLWSDGSRVLAEDYVRSFQRLLSVTSKNPNIELLKRLKNADRIITGSVKSDTLGVKSLGKYRLQFEFASADPDFLYKLTSSVLAPVKTGEFNKREQASKDLVTGPYRIESWTPNRRIRLVRNERYARGNPQRPAIEVLFIEDDQTALDLYEQGTLTFLRRLPVHHIPAYRKRPDFLQIPMARFDYIGFGEELKEQPALRAALSKSADFRELQKIYDALGIPGCPGLSESFMDQVPCVTFNLKEAKANYTKVDARAKSKRYKLVFSKLGGDDIKKGMEWLQAQWKKNLGIQVDLEQAEQGVYLHTLRTKPPAVFRKGVGLDRPTCLAALETFAAGGSENFLRLSDPDYEKILSELARAPQGTARSKKVCREGLEYLLSKSLFIPLGRIHFTLLAQPRFKGWHLNEMNQLNLADLSYEKP